MAISTYTELLAAVASYADRDDLEPVFGTFTGNVEATLNRRLEDPDQELFSTSTATGNYTALPADFGSMVSVSTGTGQPLRAMSSSEYAGLDEAIVGTERFYTITDGSIAFYPRNSTATITMVYRRTIPALTAAAPTNWLLTRAPDVYLYGTLFEESIWERDTQAAQQWKALLESAVTELMSDGARRKWGAGAIAPRVRRT